MDDFKLNSSFSASVLLYRKARHLSAEDCAKVLGVSKTALLNIERRQANPTLDTVEIIAKSMGVDPLSLLGGTDAPNLMTSMFLMNLLQDGKRFSVDTLLQAADHIQAALLLLAAAQIQNDQKTADSSPAGKEKDIEIPAAQL